MLNLSKYFTCCQSKAITSVANITHIKIITKAAIRFTGLPWCIIPWAISRHSAKTSEGIIVSAPQETATVIKISSISF
jgi:hypothetical protein